VGAVLQGWACFTEKSVPIPSQSSDAVQALEKILFPVTVECRHGTIDLLTLAVCHALAAP